MSIQQNNNKRVVLHIHQNFYPYRGGSTMRLLNLIKNDSQFNHVVISRKLDGDNDYDVHCGIKIYRYSHFYQIPCIMAKLIKLFDIKIIHAHNYRPGVFACLVNLFAKRPFILEMHSIYDVKGTIKNFLKKWVLKKAQKIIVISESSREMLVGFDIPREKVEVIYNGIEIDRFASISNDQAPWIQDNEFQAFLEKNKGNIIVGYVGSLKSFQGIDNIVEISKHLNNDKVALLVVGGSKSESNDLKNKIQYENAYVRPFVDQDQVHAVYSVIRVLLMPRPLDRKTDSAVPLKPIEALASGCLVYSTNVAGMLELKAASNTNRIQIMNIDEMIRRLNTLDDSSLDATDMSCDLTPFDLRSQQKKLDDLYLSVLTH